MKRLALLLAISTAFTHPLAAHDVYIMPEDTRELIAPVFAGDLTYSLTEGFITITDDSGGTFVLTGEGPEGRSAMCDNEYLYGLLGNSPMDMGQGATSISSFATVYEYLAAKGPEGTAFVYFADCAAQTDVTTYMGVFCAGKRDKFDHPNLVVCGFAQEPDN